MPGHELWVHKASNFFQNLNKEKKIAGKILLVSGEWLVLQATTISVSKKGTKTRFDFWN
jgi:hypothetical protein